MLRATFTLLLLLAVLATATAQPRPKSYRRAQKSRHKAGYYHAARLKATGAGKRKTKASRGDYYLAPGMAMQKTDHRHIDSYMGDVPARKHYAKPAAASAPSKSTTLRREGPRQ